MDSLIPGIITGISFVVVVRVLLKMPWKDMCYLTLIVAAFGTLPRNASEPFEWGLALQFIIGAMLGNIFWWYAVELRKRLSPSNTKGGGV